jgi:hypothetical protein
MLTAAGYLRTGGLSLLFPNSGLTFAFIAASRDTAWRNTLCPPSSNAARMRNSRGPTRSRRFVSRASRHLRNGRRANGGAGQRLRPILIIAIPIALKAFVRIKLPFQCQELGELRITCFDLQA